jgi:hypothetical protein
VTNASKDERALFLTRCGQWLCDGYNSDIRYLATVNADTPSLYDALILLNPLPHSVDHSLRLRAHTILAGQEQASKVSKTELLSIVEKALSGSMTVGGIDIALPPTESPGFSSGAISSSTWFQPLTCQIVGGPASAMIENSGAVDSVLRSGTPPFDGADDLRSWLGLRLPTSGYLSTITISVNPPVDILTERSGFTGDRLRLVLSACKAADRSQVRLACRVVPSAGLEGRKQIAADIEWRDIGDSLLEGVVELELPDATGALTMLIVGSDTVRRHWFLHPTKASNYRYSAVRQFDSDLRMVRHGLFESQESWRFEAAVSALLFMLGFSATVQLETNSPDLVVATPAGRIVLVECATRVADLGAKIGKLVDRRGALQKALRAGTITAALVCRLPRDQIAAQSDYVRSMGIVLATAEDLTQGVARAHLLPDADGILTQALELLTVQSPPIAPV